MDRDRAAWRVAFSVPASAAGPVLDLLAGQMPAVSAFGADDEPMRQIEAYSDREPDRTALSVKLALVAGSLGIEAPALTIEAIPPTDWLAATYKAFPAIRVGRFTIHGSHDPTPVPAGSIGLCIDAATAFGTGEHETTAGCLTALQRVAKRRQVRRALDMGCGSGILAMAAARLWRAPVLAVDIDREAVRVARSNTRLNRVGRWVTAIAADGYADRRVAAAGPFDLIVANILARPLASMARDLSTHLAPGGVAVLAGLLTRQQAQVLAAHRAQRLALVERVTFGDWPTLVLTKPEAGTTGPPRSRALSG